MELKYKPEHQSTVPDALSRDPVEGNVMVTVTINSEEEQILGKVQAEQQMDHKLAQLIECLEQGVLDLMTLSIKLHPPKNNLGLHP